MAESLLEVVAFCPRLSVGRALMCCWIPVLAAAIGVVLLVLRAVASIG